MLFQIQVGGRLATGKEDFSVVKDNEGCDLQDRGSIQDDTKRIFDYSFDMF